MEESPTIDNRIAALKKSRTALCKSHFKKQNIGLINRESSSGELFVIFTRWISLYICASLWVAACLENFQLWNPSDGWLKLSSPMAIDGKLFVFSITLLLTSDILLFLSPYLSENKLTGSCRFVGLTTKVFLGIVSIHLILQMIIFKKFYPFNFGKYFLRSCPTSHDTNRNTLIVAYIVVSSSYPIFNFVWKFVILPIIFWLNLIPIDSLPPTKIKEITLSIGSSDELQETQEVALPGIIATWADESQYIYSRYVGQIDDWGRPHGYGEWKEKKIPRGFLVSSKGFWRYGHKHVPHFECKPNYYGTTRTGFMWFAQNKKTYHIFTGLTICESCVLGHWISGYPRISFFVFKDPTKNQFFDPSIEMQKISMKELALITSNSSIPSHIPKNVIWYNDLESPDEEEQDQGSNIFAKHQPSLSFLEAEKNDDLPQKEKNDDLPQKEKNEDLPELEKDECLPKEEKDEGLPVFRVNLDIHPTNKEMEVVIFIHGFLTPPDMCCKMFGQMWALMNMPSRFIPSYFFWECGKTPLDFWKARKTASEYQTFMSLENIVKGYRIRGIKKFHFICHSMGCRLFLTSLSFLKERIFSENSGLGVSIQTVILLNPEVFVKEFIAKFYPIIVQISKFVSILVDKNDKILRLAEISGFGKASVGRHPEKLSYLPKIEVLDCTNVDTNIHPIRHVSFNLNTTILEDFRELLELEIPSSNRKRIENVLGSLYVHRTPPSFVKTVTPFPLFDT